MEEILEIYRLIKEGKQNLQIFNYENINVHFSGGVLNVYDISGKMPCGKYKLPSDETKFIEMVMGISQRVGEIVDNNQYICGKCGQTFDLPEYRRNKDGVPVCEDCCNGGDIRAKDAPKPKIEKSEESRIPSTIPSTIPKSTPMTPEAAIRLLQESGYVVKRLIKSYKVVYKGSDGIEKISSDYYKNKEEFDKSSKGKFISLIKELSTSEEESI